MMTMLALLAALSGPADLVLLNGNVYTVDGAAPRATAVAVRGDRIIYVGDDAGAAALKGGATRVIDLRGATVVPGLTDAHGHMAGLGFLTARLDVVGTRSAKEVAGLVAGRAASAAPGRWIVGRGWDQNDWEKEVFPTRADLDGVSPRNPVALTRVDGHALWANSAAMKLAGITKQTAAPAGGQIIRDAAGEPTGIFVDNAADLIESKIPAPTRDETREALVTAMRRCLASGLTEVHDAGASPLEQELYREILVKERFPFRVYAMISGEPASGQKPEVGLGGGHLTIRAVKFYMDGALGSRGAALLAPYDDDPGNTGLLRMDPAAMKEAASRAARAGFQVCIHAIGDRGNRLALDVLQAAGAAGGRPDQRHRIEHAQVLSPPDLARFAPLGVIASMQPTHATSDMYWAADRLGPDRVRGAYAWRSVRDTGARLACGSDFPVESENPLLGFYAAVTRQDVKGWPEGGWTPAQRMTRDEALRCFTIDAAWAAFEEKDRGSIEAGKLADMTVLSQDIMTAPPAAIPGTAVTMTIVGGQVAYERR